MENIPPKSMSDLNAPVRLSAGKKKGGAKTIEETYTKKTQLEHILLRPDTYGMLATFQ